MLFPFQFLSSCSADKIWKYKKVKKTSSPTSGKQLTVTFGPVYFQSSFSELFLNSRDCALCAVVCSVSLFHSIRAFSLLIIDSFQELLVVAT